MIAVAGLGSGACGVSRSMPPCESTRCTPAPDTSMHQPSHSPHPSPISLQRSACPSSDDSLPLLTLAQRYGGQPGIASALVSTPAPAEAAPQVPQRGPVWAQVEGMRMVPIEQITASPYRARRWPDLASLAPLVESLMLGVQPIPPLPVRQKDGQLELLAGLRIMEALRQGLGATEVAVMVHVCEDDLQAAFLVIGDNWSDYNDSCWENMRSVGMLLRVGGRRVTQREIARRHHWNESDVSEWKHWDAALTNAVLHSRDIGSQFHPMSAVIPSAVPSSPPTSFILVSC